MSAKLATKNQAEESTNSLVAKVKLIAKIVKDVTAENLQLVREINELKATIKDLKALLRKHEDTRSQVKQRLVKIVNQLPRK